MSITVQKEKALSNAEARAAADEIIDRAVADLLSKLESAGGKMSAATIEHVKRQPPYCAREFIDDSTDESVREAIEESINDAIRRDVEGHMRRDVEGHMAEAVRSELEHVHKCYERAKAAGEEVEICITGVDVYWHNDPQRDPYLGPPAVDSRPTDYRRCRQARYPYPSAAAAGS